MKILVAGGPKVGKTTFAETLGVPVKHTDDLIGKLEWSEASSAVARWIDDPGPWVIEGVAVTRALRKWLAKNGGKPADCVYWADRARAPLNREQRAMARGCATVWKQVREELAHRGVDVRCF